MPEQASRRGVAVTGQDFTQPFETPVLRLAAQGLTLNAPLDATEITRLTNLVPAGSTGALTTRPGLTALATAAGSIIHSVKRINTPRTASYTRIWGVDASLYAGASGALSAIDSGYSGDPLTLIPYRPPQSADAWMYIGDRTRTRKVRASDSLDLPISPVPPALAAATTLEEEQRTPIAAFDTSDGTDATAWVGTSGFGFNESASTPTGAVEITGSDSLDDTLGGGVAFGCTPGALGAFAPQGYWYMAGMPKTLDLSKTGTYDAEDADLIHINLNLSHVDFIQEVRLYFVVSEDFSASVLPGTLAGTNTDFYMKGFSAHDFASAVLIQKTLVEAAEDARIHAIRDRDLLTRSNREDPRESWAIRRAERDTARSRAPQGPAGNDAWTELGVLGVPLRRGDFQRVGALEDRDWSTITGMIIFVRVGEKAGPVSVRLDDLYMYGGSGPDTAEPGAQQLDYRYTHYDPRTGDETNGSPEQDAAVRLDALRRAVLVAPVAYGDAAIRQRFYRRGGSLTADWYYLGTNDADGASFQDRLTDAALSASATLELDNDQFLTSLDEDGDTLHGVAAPVIFGPVEDLLLALGTTTEPGHVYWSKAGRPGSWPPQNKVEVCSPSEGLQAGGVWGGQAFCFSRERLFWLYPNLGGETATITAAPSGCARGMINRWALAITPAGIAFLNEDGIYLTTGGPVGPPITQELDPIFHGQTINGYAPVDLSNLTALRLEYFQQEIRFLYADTQGTRQELAYNLLTKAWRHAQYAIAPSVIYADEGDAANLLILGGRAGTAYTEGGLTDAGTAIEWRLRTGAVNFGRPREDKLLGDLILDLDRGGSDVGVRTFLNEESVANPQLLLATGLGRQRYIIDPFGTSPQKARTLSVHLSGESTLGRAVIYQIGGSIIPQPDLTVNRVTQWDDLGHPDEVYLTGLTLDVDSGNVAREFLIEYDIEGELRSLGPYVVQANNRHKFKFSWPAVKANLVRIRPIGDCLAWILYRADWIFDPEPPRIAGWDINVENGWDQYFTGVDLDCNTFGLVKVVEVSIDGTTVLTAPVTTPGRRVVHLTVQPPVRGHLLRFVATDRNPGLLYGHRIQADPEPSEQTNWNQNYTIAGALSDKYLKGILIECDTYGQTKQLQIEIDGAVVDTLSVNTSGRLVKQLTLQSQQLGRVFRMLPVDSFPGRIYSLQWVFDQEPLALQRWETQELDFNLPGFLSVLYTHVTYKSSVPVTLSMEITYTLRGDRTTQTYTLPTTYGRKVKRKLPFQSNKGVQYKFIFTADEPFWLYREETQVQIQPWGMGQQLAIKPWGNDDTDATRSMTNASLAASRSGGGTS